MILSTVDDLFLQSSVFEKTQSTLDVYETMIPTSKRIRSKEGLWMFRAKLKRLYKEFEDKLDALCREHRIEINCWYSPSTIPQPQFLFGKVVIEADTLYNEDEFNLLFLPKGVLNNRQNSKLARKDVLKSY